LTDIYSDVRAFAAKASEAGLGLLTGQLIEAIEVGSSATEILSGVEWVLRQARDADLPPALASERKDLARRINQLLR